MMSRAALLLLIVFTTPSVRAQPPVVKADLRYVVTAPTTYNYAFVFEDRSPARRASDKQDMRMLLSPAERGIRVVFVPSDPMARGDTITAVITPRGAIVQAPVQLVQMGPVMIAILPPVLSGVEIIRGNSWTDTTTPPVPPGAPPTKAITNGRYERDTVVNGRTLAVIRMEREEVHEIATPQSTAQPTVTLVSSSSETILWDSTRHIPVYRLVDLRYTSTAGRGSATQASSTLRFTWTLQE
jgi:hypothetical protein